MVLTVPGFFGISGGQWPPLRGSPICADCFPAHRRGDHWSPVLPYALPVRLSAGPPFCFRRAAGGRPYEKAPSVRLAFRSRRRGDHWSPVLPCAFRMAFRRPAILLPAGGQWPPLREGPICAACIPEPPLRWVRVNKFSEPNAVHRATNLLYKAHPQPI